MDIIVLSQSDEIEERKNSDTTNTETDPEIYYGSRKWEWGFLRVNKTNCLYSKFFSWKRKNNLIIPFIQTTERVQKLRARRVL
jgi:hypothetical protein